MDYKQSQVLTALVRFIVNASRHYQIAPCDVVGILRAGAETDPEALTFAAQRVMFGIESDIDAWKNQVPDSKTDSLLIFIARDGTPVYVTPEFAKEFANDPEKCQNMLDTMALSNESPGPFGIYPLDPRRPPKP